MPYKITLFIIAKQNSKYEKDGTGEVTHKTCIITTRLRFKGNDVESLKQDITVQIQLIVMINISEKNGTIYRARKNHLTVTRRLLSKGRTYLQFLK